MIRIRAWIIVIGCLIGTGLIVDCWSPSGLIVEDAQARIGRPLTPGSVAGVARRTTRRHVRRSTIYVASLPRSCTTVVIEGTTLTQCGTTYYQPHGSQYVVVYVN